MFFSLNNVFLGLCEIVASELEPLVDDRSNKEKELNSEYKKKFRPFSHYQYINGRFSKKRPVAAIENVHKDFSADLDNDSSWYREVVELRKKAGEYKVVVFIILSNMRSSHVCISA